jgi:hypothetical protein
LAQAGTRRGGACGRDSKCAPSLNSQSRARHHAARQDWSHGRTSIRQMHQAATRRKKQHDQGRQTNSFAGSTPPSAARCSSFRASGRRAGGRWQPNTKLRRSLAARSRR